MHRLLVPCETECSEHLGTVCKTFFQSSPPALGCWVVLGFSPTPEDSSSPVLLPALGENAQTLVKFSSRVTAFLHFFEQTTINCCSVAQVVQGQLSALLEKIFMFSCVSLTAKEAYLTVTSSWGLTNSLSLHGVRYKLCILVPRCSCGCCSIVTMMAQFN